MRKTFTRVNPRKAADPDSTPSHKHTHTHTHTLAASSDHAQPSCLECLQTCSISLSQTAVSTCVKMSTIVPVPKKAKVAELNDYRPVALTSVIMKCFERSYHLHLTTTHSNLHTALMDTRRQSPSHCNTGAPQECMLSPLRYSVHACFQLNHQVALFHCRASSPAQYALVNTLVPPPTQAVGDITWFKLYF